MKKILLALSTLFIFLVSLVGCGQTAKQQTQTKSSNITISAAASLKSALDEMKTKYEQKSGDKLTFNYGSSGSLQKQIEQGASVDLFISAGASQMDALANKNLIDKNSRKNILSNKLVLIVSKDYKDKIKNISDLQNMNVKIALGESSSVPAGQYAKETLTKLNLWDKLSPKFVFAKDVTQVANYVEKGDATAGIVYKSDTVTLKNCTIAQTFDESLHKPIVYPAAIVTSSKNKDAAKKFLQYLQSAEAKSIFEKYSFQVAK